MWEGPLRARLGQQLIGRQQLLPVALPRVPAAPSPARISFATPPLPMHDRLRAVGLEEWCGVRLRAGACRMISSRGKSRR